MKAQKQVFQALKNEFKKKPILVHFNYNKKEVINTDALKHIIKAHLQQLDDQEQKQLIACYTQKLMSIK